MIFLVTDVCSCFKCVSSVNLKLKIGTEIIVGFANNYVSDTYMIRTIFFRFYRTLSFFIHSQG